ncbi:MAG: hypothetical protein IKP76_03685 [Bacilli bacterium]|nr:hypothetical protein [Bacilli bacterium]
MNIEELKQYRNELLKNHEKQYICVKVGYDLKKHKHYIKTDGKPLTKTEIMNNTNTEEGIREFEKTMVDVINQSKIFNYDYKKIYLYSNIKFYCEVSKVNKIIELHDLLYKEGYKRAVRELPYLLDECIENGDIITNYVPIMFNYARLISYYNDIDDTDITKQYNIDDYGDENWEEFKEMFLKSKEIIVNLEDYNKAIADLGYKTIDWDWQEVDIICQIKEAILEEGEDVTRRTFTADLRNLKKTKKR